MEKAIDYCLYLWLMISFAVSGSYCQTSQEYCVPAAANESTTIHLTVSNVTYITSPQFSPSKFYPGNLDLNWTIVAAPVSSVLLLRLLSFHLEAENGTKCPTDSLSIYDQNNSFNDQDMCGVTPPLWPSDLLCTKGNTVLIRFRTDDTWCYGGFNMSIEALDNSQAILHPKCFNTISTTTTLASTRLQSTPITKSVTSQTETDRNSWSTSSAPSTISMSVSTSKTEGPKGSPNTGAIVGGVVGGLLAAALLVGLFVFLKPRLFRRSNPSVKAEEEPPSDITDDKTTSALFSPPPLIREPTCAPAATFPEPRPFTARKHLADI